MTHSTHRLCFCGFVKIISRRIFMYFGIIVLKSVNEDKLIYFMYTCICALKVTILLLTNFILIWYTISCPYYLGIRCTKQPNIIYPLLGLVFHKSMKYLKLQDLLLQRVHLYPQ